MKWAEKTKEIIYNFYVAPLSLSPYGQFPRDKSLQAGKRRWDNAYHRQFYMYFHQGLKMQAYPLTQLRTLFRNQECLTLSWPEKAAV